MRRFHLIPVLLATVLGCASASTVPRPSNQSFVSPRNVITDDEIRAHSSAVNALAAIKGLRPEFLRAPRGRNQVPAVFVDGIRSYDLMALRGIDSKEIREIRYLRPFEALSLHNGPAGVIAITTRQRRPGS